MKKLLLLALVSSILMSFTMVTGLCENLIFFKEGTQITMTSYNADGKVTGSTETTYQSVTRTQSGVSVTASQNGFDKKGKPTTTSNFNIRCENGILYFDMKMMLPDQQADAYKDFEMKVEGADKEIPSNFIVGEKLKDANIKFSFSSKDGAPMPMMNLAMDITNRKIEAKESVTTSAGTYECYKISEDVEMKTVLNIKMKIVSWFSPEVGTVKTESYKENGKFSSRTELTAIK